MCTYKILKRQEVSESQKWEYRRNFLTTGVRNIYSLFFPFQISHFGLAKPPKNEGRDYTEYK